MLVLQIDNFLLVLEHTALCMLVDVLEDLKLGLGGLVLVDFDQWLTDLGIVDLVVIAFVVAVALVRIQRLVVSHKTCLFVPGM